MRLNLVQYSSAVKSDKVRKQTHTQLQRKQLQNSNPTTLEPSNPETCSLGTLKPYDSRTLKPWNFQTYNNPQKGQTPPEKPKDWNPGTLKLWKVWFPKSPRCVKPCSPDNQNLQP